MSYLQGHEALIAWSAIGLGVIAYEAFAPEGQLLSQGVDEALILHPVATFSGIATVALHLLNLIPTEIDPIHHLALVYRRGVKKLSAVQPGGENQCSSARPAAVLA